MLELATLFNILPSNVYFVQQLTTTFTNILNTLFFSLEFYFIIFFFLLYILSLIADVYYLYVNFKSRAKEFLNVLYIFSDSEWRQRCRDNNNNENFIFNLQKTHNIKTTTLNKIETRMSRTIWTDGWKEGRMDRLMYR